MDWPWATGGAAPRTLSSPPFLQITRTRNTILGLGSIRNDPTVVTDLTLSAADPELRRLLVRDDDFCADEQLVLLVLRKKPRTYLLIRI